MKPQEAEWETHVKSSLSFINIDHPGYHLGKVLSLSQPPLSSHAGKLVKGKAFALATANEHRLDLLARLILLRRRYNVIVREWGKSHAYRANIF